MWDTEQWPGERHRRGGPIATQRRATYGLYLFRPCTGYYCPVNSTSPTQVPCPPGRYGPTDGQKDDVLCPVPTRPLLPLWYSGPNCPAGSSATSGLVSEECSNECWEGGCEPNLCQRDTTAPRAASMPAVPVRWPAYYCPTEPQYPPRSQRLLPSGPSSGGLSHAGGTADLPARVLLQGQAQIPCPPGTYGDSTAYLLTPAAGLPSKPFAL